MASFLRQSQNEAELNNSSSSLVRTIVRIQRIRASSGEKADRSIKSIVAQHRGSNRASQPAAPGSNLGDKTLISVYLLLVTKFT